MSQIGAPSGGQAAGSQAQFANLLQILTKILAALTPPPNPYAVQPWTAAGDLVIATAFPDLTAGMFSIRQGTAAAINVTLPNSGGPWGVADGAGVAAADNITVLPPAGFTILGTSSYVISTDWDAALFVLDGTNYIVAKWAN